MRVRTSQVNAAKFLLRSVGQGLQATSLKTGRAWQTLLQNPAGEPARCYLAMHADLWSLAREKVLALEEKLKTALRPFEETRRRLEITPQA